MALNVFSAKENSSDYCNVKKCFVPNDKFEILKNGRKRNYFKSDKKNDHEIT